MKVKELEERISALKAARVLFRELSDRIRTQWLAGGSAESERAIILDLRSRIEDLDKDVQMMIRAAEQEIAAWSLADSG